MLTRRLHVLLDDDRYRRLTSDAERRSVFVAVVVREAIDAALPGDSDERCSAARSILEAAAMPVPDPEGLRAELDGARSPRG